MKKILNFLFVCSLMNPVLAWSSEASPVSCTTDKIPEISCDKSSCGASDAATPLSFDVDDTGVASACMYSGCYEGGTLEVFKSESFISYHVTRATWSGESKEKQDIVVSIPINGGMGSMIAAGFNMPIFCKLTGSASK